MRHIIRGGRSLAPALLLVTLALAGCSEERGSFMDAGGPIAADQFTHMVRATMLIMIVVLPVLILVPLIVWRYHYRNRNADYAPNWHHSTKLEILMWGVPFFIVALLAAQLWINTKREDPYIPIEGASSALNVQVVGLDWKWLFIYPDHGIATVNELAIPIDASVALDLTTDTVMQSFMIGALAGQIYAMPGMRTKLHILADEPGTYIGENMQFNGRGFAQQKFRTVAMSDAEFEAWVAGVKSKGVPLDEVTYGQLGVASTGAEAHEALATPEMPDEAIYFSEVKPHLFHEILMRYMGGKTVPPEEQPGAPGYIPPVSEDGATK